MDSVKKKIFKAVVRNPLDDPGAFFQAWAETAPEIFFIVGQNLRLTYTNSFTAGLLHKKSHYLVGKHLKEIFPPEDLAIQRRNLKRVFHSGVSQFPGAHRFGNSMERLSPEPEPIPWRRHLDF